MSSHEEHEEIERKYEVDERTVLPTLVGVEGVHAIRQAVEQHLDAVYFDTRGRDLLRHGVTLRRRTGGSDAGWHLKMRGSGDARIEVRQPLEDEPLPARDDSAPARDETQPAQDESPSAKRDRPGTGEWHPVPPALLDQVRAIVRDRPLEPVMRIRTRRRERAVVAEDGVVLAQLCDDEVTAEPLDGSAPAQSWREWEVELVEGPRTLLTAVEERLREAGARPATTASKLARSLGSPTHAMTAPLIEPGVRPGHSQEAAHQRAKQATMLEVLRADLSRRAAALEEHDRGVRSGRASAVHRMRITARRLRAVLSSCGPLFEKQDSTGRLREELRWIGQALAAARDAQVLHERLVRTLDAEPPELVLGSVRARLDEELGRRQVAGLQLAREALDSGRYFRLLDALDEVSAKPPVTAEAEAAATDVLPRLLARDAKRLRRAVAAAERAAPGTARDAALHESRKKAKRLRYAAQFAEPVLGQRAHALASGAKSVQQALGSHQDCVVARQLLRELGVRAHLEGENAFTFGRLHALEQWQADRAEEEFWEAWRRLPHRGVRRWLVG